MTATHGDRVLAGQEARARRRSARRRRHALLLPALAATLWALAELVAARHARLAEAGAPFLRHVADHGEVIVWTLALVVVPLALSLGPQPMTSGAALAFLCGPLGSPLLFGAGGWRLWQSTVVALVAALVLGAAATRRRAAARA